MKSICSFWSLALGLGLLATVAGRAETGAPAKTNAPASAPARERFLVIVETSAAMQKRADNTQKALGSVIASGLKGEMESGCTVGLWTFNEQLFTGQIPLQLWTPDNRQRVAQALMQVVQQQKYEKASRLGMAWQRATNIVAQSERITVLLFTAGSEPVIGTPFDAEIAESFKKNDEQQRKANMPFVTILRAFHGKIVAYAVNMPPWPLEVPEWPDEFKPAPAPPEPKPAPVVAPATAVKPQKDPAVLSPTNVIYLVETSPPVVVPVVAPAPAPAPTNPAVAAPQPVAMPRTNPPAVAAVVEPKPKPADAPKVASPPATEAVAPQGKLPLKTILIVGLGGLLGLLVVFLVLLRRSRRTTGESLITRSMHRHDR
jgi:hypothetical protein